MKLNLQTINETMKKCDLDLIEVNINKSKFETISISTESSDFLEKFCRLAQSYGKKHIFIGVIKWNQNLAEEQKLLEEDILEYRPFPDIYEKVLVDINEHNKSIDEITFGTIWYIELFFIDNLVKYFLADMNNGLLSMSADDMLEEIDNCYGLELEERISAKSKHDEILIRNQKKEREIEIINSILSNKEFVWCRNQMLRKQFAESFYNDCKYDDVTLRDIVLLVEKAWIQKRESRV